MTATANTLSFSATVGESTTVTVTNIGGVNLTGVNSSATTITGSATTTTTPAICVDASGNSTSTNLPIGGHCIYTVNVNDSNVDTGNINLSISGNYSNGSTQTYSRKLAMGYISNPYRALLSISPKSMTIIGNNTESSTQTLIVNNDGEAPAAISGSDLTSAPNYLAITSDGCNGQIIPSGGSCPVMIQLGPTTTESTITGSALYAVIYSGGQASSATTTTTTTTTATIPYVVQANNLILSNVNLSSSSITGDGSSESGHAFIIPGNLINPAITLTYTNNGSNPLQITGIMNINSPISWAIDTIASTCYNAGQLPSAFISESSNCTIVFNNVLAYYAQAVTGGIGSSYIENLIVPTLVLKDQEAPDTRFIVQPPAPAPINGTILYVTGNQATLVTNASYNNGMLTIGQNLANAANYSAIALTIKTEDYFTGTPTTDNCLVSTDKGVETQICTLIPLNGIASASVVYTVNLTIYPSATFHFLTDLNAESQVVSFTPSIPDIPFP